MADEDLQGRFSKRLAASRLGIEHDTLGIFRKAANFTASKHKEYSLVVVTETARRRILLGRKHRGFGHGMYNSFGGKIEPGETPAQSAQRELEEETGLALPLAYVEQSRLGTIFFTFDDSPTEMIVHLFRVHVACEDGTSYHRIDPSKIRGCDEITPQWFDDWSNIPLDNMFADDSVWLTRVLTSDIDLSLDGWFHFEPGGQEVNTIRHYHVDIRPRDNNNSSSRLGMTLEKRLFGELHRRQINSPKIKEFNEAYVFCNSLRAKKHEFDVVIDVAGGHGALAALFLITTSAQTAVVVDPAQVGGGGVERAWASYYKGKSLRYRHECLRTGLPAELDRALVSTPSSRILVVACHACQHLSDEIVEIACRYGVSSAVMPCCQKDLSPGSSWKSTSKNLSIPVVYTMDILLAGKAMSWNVGQQAGVRYDVRMKVINASITPQNRLLFCRAVPASGESNQPRTKAHQRLEQAYKRAHGNVQRAWTDNWRTTAHILGGFALGVVASMLVLRRS